ncbi:MAG TPA: ethylbenzene dehydrogenase-related protein [Acidimicrobiales bacterium]
MRTVEMRSRLTRMSQTRRRALVLVATLAAALTLQTLGANPAVPQGTSLTALRAAELPDLDPGDSLWQRAPEVQVPLTAQNVTYPFGGGSLPAVRVRAMHDGESLLVRVAWPDRSEDTSAVRAEDFADAVAVQFPATAGSTAPAVCMGQADGGVNIWQWRADSEGDLSAAAADLHEGAYADLESTDDVDFPAREVGNPYAQLGGGPVQDLVATGFGTLEPAGEQEVAGRGARDGDGWAVVFARPFAAADASRPGFAVGTTTDVALAAWDGSQGDRNGQKSVSAFLRLSLSDERLPSRPRPTAEVVAVSVGVVGGLFAMVLGITLLSGRTRRPEA